MIRSRLTADSPRSEKTLEILRILQTTYPNAHCELDYSTPFQLLIATILSAQCTDARVNIVTPVLFQKYPDADAMASAKLSDIEEIIHSTGFYRNKAKNILETSKTLSSSYAGTVPQSMDALISLPGVGRKTANVVLGNAFNIESGIVVDTHVARLSQRLGLTKATDPVKIERDLMKLVPRGSWTLWSHLLILHGRRRCTARKPDCENCELRHLCTWAARH